jgi:hypothetical protein
MPDGKVYLRKNGLPSGSFATANINTLTNIMMVFMLLLHMGVPDDLVVAWPLAVYGDDILTCWPFEESFFDVWHEYIYPATGQEATNENPGGGLVVSLIDAQILSFGFKRLVCGTIVAVSLNTNKAIARIIYSKKGEDWVNVAKQLFVIHRFNSILNPLIRTHLCDLGLSGQSLAQLELQADRLHLGFESCHWSEGIDACGIRNIAFGSD